MFKSVTAYACLIVGIAAAGTSAYCAGTPDLDPNALAVLKSTVNSIASAKTFSFRVLVSHDREATNNQLVTYFNYQTVTVSRPDKLRVDVDGEHHDVQFYFDGKNTTLYEPEGKLYASQPAPSTIDEMLQAIEKRGISLPMSDLLQSDSYDSLVKGLQTAYVVGRVNINKKTFVHLVFTEPSADWQLWVEPGDKPVPRAMTIIYKTQPGSPRVTMDFSDWNLNAEAPSETFEFVKPDDAHQIQFFPSKGAQ